MEESPVLLNKPFTIKTMPFATERIVYYVSIPSPSLSNLPNLYKKLTVSYVERKIFDSRPLAIQVHYQEGNHQKIVAELLFERFEVPYLDNLFSEKQLDKKDYLRLRDFKFTHYSTQKMLKDEVYAKLCH